MKHFLWLACLSVTSALQAGAPVPTKVATQISWEDTELELTPCFADTHFAYLAYTSTHVVCCFGDNLQKPKPLGSSTETRLTNLEMKHLKFTPKQEVKLENKSAPSFKTGFELSAFAQH